MHYYFVKNATRTEQNNANKYKNCAQTLIQNVNGFMLVNAIYLIGKLISYLAIFCISKCHKSQRFCNTFKSIAHFSPELYLQYRVSCSQKV